MGAIKNFSGDFSFLSNFYKSPILVGFQVYPTVEHYYQAEKTVVQAQRDLIIYSATPGEAKALGRKAELRPDWEEIKIQVMLRGLNAKFQPRSYLANKLTATGIAYLEEGNTWGDTYWGVCNGVGENRLGRLLMSVRTALLDYNALLMPTTKEIER